MLKGTIQLSAREEVKVLEGVPLQCKGLKNKKKLNYSGITNCYCLALVPQSPKLGDLCAGWCCFSDCHLGILEN